MSDLRQRLAALAPGRWATTASAVWANPNGALWGGYPIGLILEVVRREPDAVGDPLSLTVTYIAALSEGEVEVRTRCLRQGGSVGVWAIEVRQAGAEQVAVHAVVITAKRPQTPTFAFAAMPDAPAPETLPIPTMPSRARRFGAQAFERRSAETFPITPGSNSYSKAWIRPLSAHWTTALLGMAADASPPRAFYAFGHDVLTTTLSLTLYLHGSSAEVAAAENDYLLVEYEGRIGSGGASDERSSYWRRDGKLLATSEQLVWYRPTPPAVSG